MNKMYENINEYVTLSDGQPVRHDKLHKSLSTVMGKMYERKVLYQAIKISMDKGKISEAEENKLQKSLDENNAYFMSLTDEDRKKFNELFEGGNENLGKSADWQNYCMLYTDLKGMSFNNQFGSYVAQLQEKKAQIKKFKDSMDELHRMETGIQSGVTPWMTIPVTMRSYKEAEQTVKKYHQDRLDLQQSREKEEEAVSQLFTVANKYENLIQSDKNSIKEFKDT